MVWCCFTVETVSPESRLPAYVIFSTLEAGPEFIGDVTLHATPGGPSETWLPSMALANVEAMIAHAWSIVETGTQLVSWGGIEALGLFNQYDLAPETRTRLRQLTLNQFDLKRAYFFALSAPDGHNPASEAPDTGPFPSRSWLSGVRTAQWTAVQHGLDRLAAISRMWQGVDSLYFEDGRSLCVRSLCNETEVHATFGHPLPVARRLSETLQDEIGEYV